MVTEAEFGYLHQLARGEVDALPLHADKLPEGYDVHSGWAQTQVSDWRAAHDPLCHCWKVSPRR